MGAAAHVVTGLKVAMERPPLITMTLPGGETIQGTQIIMGNGKRYGGSAHLFANASLDDGRLDAAIIDQENIGILFEVLGLIISRGATPSNISEFTELRKLQSCTLTCEKNLPYHLDGDYAGTLVPGEKLIIERQPHKLKVCMPINPVPLSPLERMMAHPAIAAMREKIEALNEV